MAAEKITPRSADYSQWYLDIVNRAGLAENSGRARLHGHQAARLRHLQEKMQLAPSTACSRTPATSTPISLC